MLISITDEKKPRARSSQSGFDRDQPWCRTNHPLTFVDENREILSLYESLSEDDEVGERTASPSLGSDRSEAASGPSPTTESTLVSSRPILGNSLPTASVASTLIDETDWASVLPRRREYDRSPSFASSLDHFLGFDLPVPEADISHDERAEFAASALAALRCSEPGVELVPVSPGVIINPDPTASPGSGLGVSQDPVNPDPVDPLLPAFARELPVWPLQDDMEAYLFRHFIDFVARSFDLCDPERHFTVVVPCRAILYSPLMNAMFAISAKHLSRNSSFDKSISDRYYQRCLTTLRPMLSHEAALMDENLFAATVILRNLEEIDGVARYLLRYPLAC